MEHTQPQYRVRLNISQLANGTYRHETTVEVMWSGERCDLVPQRTSDGGSAVAVPLELVLERLNKESEIAAQNEIARRETLDVMAA